MKDKILRVITKNGGIRVMLAHTTGLCEKAREIHDTWPVVTAALGRCLTAVSMLGQTIKEENATISIQIKGDGPIGSIAAVSDINSNVRGYVHNTAVELPLLPNNKLNVGAAVGKGTFTVVKDLKLKEPYIGKVDLQTGEIADDLTYYFASSEQTPSVVALGVLVNTDWSVKSAGGYIVQLMPGALEEDICNLEYNISKIKPISALFDEGKTCGEILDLLLMGFEYDILEERETLYKCNCSRERITSVLLSIGKKDLNEIINDGKDTELVCHFCGSKYNFTVDEIKKEMGA